MVRVGIAIAFFIMGGQVAEILAWTWHRLVWHQGILRHIGRDFFRRRHFHHHRVYNPKRHWSARYEPSCDLSFLPSALLYIGITVWLMWRGSLSPLNGISLLAGSVLYLTLVLDQLHALFHREEADLARKRWLTFFSPVWRTFLWMRAYHRVHHVAGGNIAVANPLFDIIGGIYMPPHALPGLQPRNQFPGFNPKCVSRCGDGYRLPRPHRPAR